MQRCKYKNIEWLTFDSLADFPNLQHGVFLRHGGVSTGPYSNLNLSFHVNDDPNHVKSNLKMINKTLQNEISNCSDITWGYSFHKKNISLIEKKTSDEIPDTDALITRMVKTPLMMLHADCQVALIYDPVNHAVANVHAGWRGCVANIYQAAIESMVHNFGSHASNLFVCISPSLGPDEAEFIHYRSEFPEEFWPFQVRPNYFDLWSISEHQFQSVGVLPHHIEIARLSTYSNSYDFFSYRRDKVTGRNGTFIMLM